MKGGLPWGKVIPRVLLSHTPPQQQPFIRQPIRPSANPIINPGAKRSAMASSGSRCLRTYPTQATDAPMKLPYTTRPPSVRLTILTSCLTNGRTGELLPVLHYVKGPSSDESGGDEPEAERENGLGIDAHPPRLPHGHRDAGTNPQQHHDPVGANRDAHRGSAGSGFLEQRRQPAHDRRKYQQDRNVRQNVSLPAFPIHAISDQSHADQQDNRPGASLGRRWECPRSDPRAECGLMSIARISLHPFAGCRSVACRPRRPPRAPWCHPGPRRRPSDGSDRPAPRSRSA